MHVEELGLFTDLYPWTMAQSETISAARLTAMPMARRCVSCQERREHRSTHA